MSSIINTHLWNKAKWSRATFASAGSSSPPFLGLIFANFESGLSIFQNWRQKIGAVDEQEVIRVRGCLKNRKL